MAGSCYLHACCVIALLLTTAHCLDRTEASALPGPPVKVGWQNGPNERGTIDILWSCISIIIACTWTILHLNAPQYYDSTKVKVLRKLKWMVITILFPEFIFSKAICELRTAVNDTYAMTLEAEKINWTVRYGRRLQILHRLFNPRSPSDTLEKSDLNISRLTDQTTWTITHTYFANMGGMVSLRCLEDRGKRGGRVSLVPITTKRMLKCCIPGNHCHLQTLSSGLDEREIQDKSKADWLVKIYAVLQIGWLAISIITRLARSLPISQLEVVTVAFSGVAIVTYAANWPKPKDVDVPLLLKCPEAPAKICAHPGCNYTEHRQDRFTKRLLGSNKIYDAQTRMQNDAVDMDTELEIPLITYILTISAAIFGGIHCIAWTSEFPTPVERLLWLVTSILSATIPLAGLLASALIVRLNFSIAFQTRETLKHRFNKPRTDCTRHCGTYDETRVVYQDGDVYLMARDHLDGGTNFQKRCADRSGLYRWYHQFFHGPHPHDYLGAFLASVEFPSAYFSDVVFICQQHGRNHPRHKLVQLQHNRDTDLPTRFAETSWWSHYLNLYDDLDSLIKPLRKADRKIEDRKKLSRYITICSGILYAIVRLTILALALVALRQQDPSLYIETWTQNLPSIS
ncbi:hypothetical protein BDV96DRAFT_640381 [Lophiotrema nucula]|uniref:Uncharacterized protein n=1 Tax=Lophiotrema nucula TaxID=690887 RepID=A0A6A5ZTX9_9PLEO|nr:hypothetical protein BDV96DRAFT_640381 [Lophiotrema nucula]